MRRRRENPVVWLVSVQGIEPRALCILDKYLTLELRFQIKHYS